MEWIDDDDRRGDRYHHFRRRRGFVGTNARSKGGATDRYG
jgi:hypothetical protein